MSLPTRGITVCAAVNSAAPTIAGFTVSAGVNPSIAIVLGYRRATTESVTTVPTRNGQPGNIIATLDVAAALGVRVYEIKNANVGSFDIVGALSATRNWFMGATVYTDVDGTTPFGTPAIAAALIATLAGMTADDEALSASIAYLLAGSAQSFSPVSPVTEIAGSDIRVSGGTIYGVKGHRTGTGSVGNEWNFTTTPDGVITVAIPVRGIVSGPTITQQPANQTVILSDGDEATFTAEYTSGGTVSGVTAEVNDGGGWDPLSEGPNVEINFNQTEAELILSNVDISMTGYQYRLTITDGSGSTVTNAATLTVKNGNEITNPVGPSDADGESTGNLSADNSNEDTPGAYKEIRLVYQSVTLLGSVRGMNP